MVAAAGGGGGGSNKKPKVTELNIPGINFPDRPIGSSTASFPGYGLHEAGAMAGPTDAQVAARPQSPEDILAALLGGDQSGAYYGPNDTTDYAAQANAVYKPQTDYLAGLEAKAKAQAKASGKTIDEVYAELSRSIGANAGNITSSYDTARSQGNQAYNTAYGNTKQSFDDSRNGVADTLQRLGIQEAAPNAVNGQMQALMQSIIGANGQAQNNAMTQGRQSALDYNSAMQSGATIRGGDARANLTSQLNGFLNELGMKKADLQTQIQQMTMQGKSDAEKSAYDRWRDMQGFNLDKAKLAQSAGKDALDEQFRRDELAAKTGASSEVDMSKLDPVGRVEAIARASYGNPQAQANAVKAVQDVIRNKQPTSLQEFYTMLEQNNMHHGPNGKMQVAGDIGTLRRMAAAMWESMYGKATPGDFGTYGIS